MWPLLTSLCVVAVCGVVPWAEAFAVVHDHSRQIVGVASSVDRVTWACAAVRFDVQNLVKGHMDADFLPMVPPRPSARIQTHHVKHTLGFSTHSELLRHVIQRERCWVEKLAWSAWGAAVEPEVNGRSEVAYVPLTELRVCGMISVFFLSDSQTTHKSIRDESGS